MKALHAVLAAAIIACNNGCAKHEPDKEIGRIASGIMELYAQEGWLPNRAKTGSGTANTYLRIIGRPEGKNTMLYFKDHKPYATQERPIGKEDKLVVLINSDKTYYLKDRGLNGIVEEASIVGVEEGTFIVREIPLREAQVLYEKTISSLTPAGQGPCTKTSLEEK